VSLRSGGRSHPFNESFKPFWTPESGDSIRFLLFDGRLNGENLGDGVDEMLAFVVELLNWG
jgi:hypothetical protein